MVSQLYQLYFWELIRYMKKSVGSIAEAEDIVQETFLRALEHADLLEAIGEAQCRAWLYRTAKNVCIDRIRHEKAEPVLREEESCMDDFSGAVVAELCEILTPLEQRLFQMRYFEGYQAAELGKQFDMPPATVRAKLMTARNKLKTYYPELIQQQAEAADRQKTCKTIKRERE